MRTGRARVTLNIATGELSGTASGRYFHLKRAPGTGAVFVPGRYHVSPPIKRRHYGLVTVLTLLEDPSPANIHVVTELQRHGQCDFPQADWVDFMRALAEDGGGELEVIETGGGGESHPGR